jgi:hypothetical protein
MRRVLLFIAIIVLAGSTVLNGQFPASLGVKAGISVANQSYKFTPIDYSMETEALGGPAFSIFLEAFKGEHFSFQLDLSYAHKGCESSTQSITVNHLDNDRIIVNEGELTKSIFHYLSLSPMARYRFGQDSFVPYILLGPRMDILLNYSSDSDYPLEGQNEIILGLTFGAGLEYKLQRIGLFTELQYQGDFYPVTGEDPLLVNNHMISLTLGVRWFVSE